MTNEEVAAKVAATDTKLDQLIATLTMQGASLNAKLDHVAQKQDDQEKAIDGIRGAQIDKIVPKQPAEKIKKEAQETSEKFLLDQLALKSAIIKAGASADQVAQAKAEMVELNLRLHDLKTAVNGTWWSCRTTKNIAVGFVGSNLSATAGVACGLTPQFVAAAALVGFFVGVGVGIIVDAEWKEKKEC